MAINTNNTTDDLTWINFLNEEHFTDLLPTNELENPPSDHTDFTDSFQKIILIADFLLDTRRQIQVRNLTETFVAKYSPDNINLEKGTDGKFKFVLSEDKQIMKIKNDYLNLLKTRGLIHDGRLSIKIETVFFVVGQILDKHIKNKDNFPKLKEFIAELISDKNNCMRAIILINRISEIAQHSIQGKNLSEAEVANLQDSLLVSAYFKNCLLIKGQTPSIKMNENTPQTKYVLNRLIDKRTLTANESVINKFKKNHLDGFSDNNGGWKKITLPPPAEKQNHYPIDLTESEKSPKENEAEEIQLAPMLSNPQHYVTQHRKHRRISLNEKALETNENIIKEFTAKHLGTWDTTWHKKRRPPS